MHKAIVEPLLVDVDLFADWLRVYMNSISDEYRIDGWILSMLKSSLELLDRMHNDNVLWANDSYAKLIDAIMNTLLDRLPTDVPPLPVDCYIETSDRWLNSALRINITPQKNGSTTIQPYGWQRLDSRFANVFLLVVDMANGGGGVAHQRLLTLCIRWLPQLCARLHSDIIMRVVGGDAPLNEQTSRLMADMSLMALILAYMSQLIDTVRTPSTQTVCVSNIIIIIIIIILDRLRQRLCIIRD